MNSGANPILFHSKDAKSAKFKTKTRIEIEFLRVLGVFAVKFFLREQKNLLAAAKMTE